MKKLKLTILLAILAFLSPAVANAQHLGISTNLLGWGTASPNLGVDVGLSKHLALDIDGMFNPFTFGENKQAHFWAVQPELRFYPRYRFAGHFIGVEGHYSMYNFGLKEYRYDGQLCGGGLSYGYSWLLGKRWNLEGVIGFGYTRFFDKDIYDIKDAQSILSDEKRAEMFNKPIDIFWGRQSDNYLGLSRAAIKFTYFIF
ncbi:MAG: DUF3575 domain-containing protein [Bacteroidales bacterium]|nr:DUF3575 domain-containing protein [Bacteroidales bacterium]